MDQIKKFNFWSKNESHELQSHTLAPSLDDLANGQGLNVWKHVDQVVLSGKVVVAVVNKQARHCYRICHRLLPRRAFDRLLIRRGHGHFALGKVLHRVVVNFYRLAQNLLRHLHRFVQGEAVCDYRVPSRHPFRNAEQCHSIPGHVPRVSQDHRRVSVAGHGGDAACKVQDHRRRPGQARRDARGTPVVEEKAVRDQRVLEIAGLEGGLGLELPSKYGRKIKLAARRRLVFFHVLVEPESCMVFALGAAQRGGAVM